MTCPCVRACVHSCLAESLLVLLLFPSSSCHKPQPNGTRKARGHSQQLQRAGALRVRRAAVRYRTLPAPQPYYLKRQRVLGQRLKKPGMIYGIAKTTPYDLLQMLVTRSPAGLGVQHPELVAGLARWVVDGCRPGTALLLECLQPITQPGLRATGDEVLADLLGPLNALRLTQGLSGDRVCSYAHHDLPIPLLCAHARQVAARSRSTIRGPT